MRYISSDRAPYLRCPPPPSPQALLSPSPLSSLCLQSKTHGQQYSFGIGDNVLSRSTSSCTLSSATFSTGLSPGHGVANTASPSFSLEPVEPPTWPTLIDVIPPPPPVPTRSSVGGEREREPALVAVAPPTAAVAAAPTAAAALAATATAAAPALAPPPLLNPNPAPLVPAPNAPIELLCKPPSRGTKAWATCAKKCGHE